MNQRTKAKWEVFTVAWVCHLGYRLVQLWRRDR